MSELLERAYSSVYERVRSWASGFMQYYLCGELPKTQGLPSKARQHGLMDLKYSRGDISSFKHHFRSPIHLRLKKDALSLLYGMLLALSSRCTHQSLSGDAGEVLRLAATFTTSPQCHKKQDLHI